jgi:hypothetical protein
MSKIIQLGGGLGLSRFGTYYQEYRATVSRVVGYKSLLLEEIKKNEGSIGFFHSLFG